MNVPASDLATTVAEIDTPAPYVGARARMFPLPLVQAALILMALWVFFQGWQRDVRVPLGFVSDSLWYLAQSKSTVDNGWWWFNPRGSFFSGRR